jgi:hypothetical protein
LGEYFLKKSFKNEGKYADEIRCDFSEMFPDSDVLHHNSVRQLMLKLH